MSSPATSANVAPHPPGAVIIDPYCRISEATDGQGGYRSVADQEEDAREDIAQHARDGWVVGQVFKDPALSGWNPKVVRPDFNRLMVRLESGQSHGLWVYDLSRFTRKPIEGERLLELAHRGIIVKSLTTAYDITTADGRKQFRDAMTAAAFESDKISERTSRGKRKKAARGKSNASWRGFAVPGYGPKPAGWEPGDSREMVPDERVAEEREVVRELARRLLGGVTLERVTRDLNEKGIRTVTGKPWSTQAVRQMLKRPSLAGLVEYRDEIVEGRALPFEAALDRATWAAVTAMFAARRRGRTPAVYLLSGIMRCGLCGAPMYGRPRINCKPYPDGEVVRQYWCQPRAHGVGCGRLTVDQRHADAVVGEAVVVLLGDPLHAQQIARRAASVLEERSKLLAEVAAAEETAVALAGKVGRDPRWTFERYDAAIGPLDDRVARLRARLADLDETESQPATEDVAAVWANAEKEGNLSVRRRLVKRAFPRLALRPAVGRGRAALSIERFDWDGAAHTGKSFAATIGN